MPHVRHVFVCHKTTLKYSAGQVDYVWEVPAMTETWLNEHGKRFDRRFAGKMQVHVNLYASRLGICRNHSITVKYIRRNVERSYVTSVSVWDSTRLAIR